MAGRRAGAGLALAAVALSAAACGSGGSTKTVTVIRTRTGTTTMTVTTTRTITTTSGSASCTGSDLSGTFGVVPGSGAAGQVSYKLTLTNTSAASCWVSGRPVVVLLDAYGVKLPTRHAAVPLPTTASLVTISPGGKAHADVRFSPDVPGAGDSQSGPCQPQAYTLRVTPNGGGTVNAPIKPPTSVCQSGTLNFSLYTAG